MYHPERMASQKVRVGIIGTGFGASVQLPAFLGMKGVDVIGVASSDPARSADLAEKHTLRSFGSYDELIACDDVDLLSIATVPADQERCVRSALYCGKHVLCEKPFTLGSDAAKSLVQEANAAGVIHAVDFEFRELPAIAFFISRLMAGVTGRIRYGEFRWIVGSWADASRPFRWQCDESLGGGVLSALGVHLHNIAECMLGPLRTLQASAGIAITERTDEKGVKQPVTSYDHATIDCAAVHGTAVRMILSNVDPAGTGLGIMIRGENGVLVLESTSQTYGSGIRVREGKNLEEAMVLYEDPAPVPGIDPRIPPFRSLAERLITAIREGDRTFSPSFQDGVRAQIFLEAVRALVVASGTSVDMGKGSK